MESAQQFAATFEDGRKMDRLKIQLIEELTESSEALKDLSFDKPSKQPRENDLKDLTRRILSARQVVDEIFGFSGFSASPAWDLMLDLYLQDGMPRQASVTDACLGARCAATTGLRWLRALEGMGLVARTADPNDKRRTYISLTSSGRSLAAKAISAYATD